MKKDLTMHRLLGEHDFIKYFNSDTYSTEEKCVVCGYCKTDKPGSKENLANTLASFRHGMLSAREALDNLGLTKKSVEEELDKVSK